MTSVKYLLCSIAVLAISPLRSHGFHTSIPPLSLASRISRNDLSASLKHEIFVDYSMEPLNEPNSPTLLKSSVALAAAFILSSASAAWAVSGGGLDYAGIDITGQDFSNGNYKGKDFTQARSSKFVYFSLISQSFRSHLLSTTKICFLDSSKHSLQVIAKGTTFAKSNLQGCRFYKAYLVSDCFAR